MIAARTRTRMVLVLALARDVTCLPSVDGASSEAYARAGGQGVPAGCTGWPGHAAIVEATNYSNADLPPLLQFANGTDVGVAAWPERRVELKRLLQQYFYGTLPAETPPLVAVRATPATGPENALRGAKAWYAELTFLCLGTTNVSFTVEVIVPDHPYAGGGGGKGHPVFVTQRNHRRWALKGVARGYAACIYPGADVDDQSLAFRAVYNDATWGTILSRSWLASRALDYLATVPGVDPARASIAGHSRNGKQSMLAAAFDDRWSAVVSSSSGSPGMAPYRSTSAWTFAEGPGAAPPQWWIWQLSCFKGWEHKLPIDSHGLLGLIAPRPLLAATAWTDGCETTWAVERAYHQGRTVYDMLGAPDNLRIKYRPGQHHGYLDVESYFDWFDVAHGREHFTAGMFPVTLYHSFDWGTWNTSQSHARAHAAPPPEAPAKDRIRWGLGVEPAGIVSHGGHYGEQCEDGPNADGCFVAEMMTHNRFKGKAANANISRADVDFGEYISASVYFPSAALAKGAAALPVVIWLHPLSYHSGFNEGYIESESGTAIYFDIAAAGFAVVCFDQMGFGTRNFELNDAAPVPPQQGERNQSSLPLFYRRYPSWSMLGKLVHDARSAVDLVTTQATHPGMDPPFGLPRFDTAHVFAVGYDVGGAVALYLSAQETRLAGVVSVNGFTPMRTDTSASHTGGVRRLWDWYALQPRLGWYDGREHDIPYDFDDVLAAAGDTPTLVYQQDYDRTANATEVAACVRSARAKGANVDLATAPTVNLLNDAAHSTVITWLKAHTPGGGGGATYA